MRKVREFHTPITTDYPGGLVQVVELADDRCIVGFKRNDDGIWHHWGLGEGGYVATCDRFSACGTFGFNPSTGVYEAEGATS